MIRSLLCSVSLLLAACATAKPVTPGAEERAAAGPESEIPGAARLHVTSRYSEASSGARALSQRKDYAGAAARLDAVRASTPDDLGSGLAKKAQLAADEYRRRARLAGESSKSLQGLRALALALTEKSDELDVETIRWDDPRAVELLDALRKLDPALDARFKRTVKVRARMLGEHATRMLEDQMVEKVIVALRFAGLRVANPSFKGKMDADDFTVEATVPTRETGEVEGVSVTATAIRVRGIWTDRAGKTVLPDLDLGASAHCRNVADCLPRTIERLALPANLPLLKAYLHS